MPAVHQVSKDRREFYRRIDKAHVAPLWEVLHTLVTPEPKTPCQPVLWQWKTMLPWVLESGKLISAKEAERRVLVLENPGLRGLSRATHSLYAGLQLILPGEIAPAHRHSQSALRLIIAGEDAYTAVEGERVTMHVGDFIVTPSWTWHDHGNPGAEPVIWMDVLDLPIVELLDAQFMERPGVESQTTTRSEGQSYARYGHTMLPIDFKPRSKTSPLFWYPYRRSRDSLAELARSEDPHPCHGHKLQFVNPASGGPAIATIGTFVQLLPKGFRGRSYRSTDSTIYCVVEGSGRVRLGEQTIAFEAKDIFVVPSWMKHQLEADADTVLFSASDRPVQQALDLWREAEG
ncbi:MAG: gentisate 1,2-dioxygenase [Betaproteobacteria bacterium]|nr:gentisate 1,2-dioxygenase [Betaproteobacteria bacterium]